MENTLMDMAVAIAIIGTILFIASLLFGSVSENTRRKKLEKKRSELQKEFEQIKNKRRLREEETRRKYRENHPPEIVKKDKELWY